MNFAAIEPELLALGQALRERGWRLAAAESCTGGLIAAACTSVAGSSDWFERGFVTYSNEAKTEQLGVEPALLAAHGAVSEPVAREMARGAQRHSHAALSVAVTGIAGPAGAVPGKPVGTVWLAIAEADGRVTAQKHCFAGSRTAVREATVLAALARLRELTQTS